MSRIIIGVHGLANKPKRATLDQGWRQSIIEGLKRNCGRTNDEIAFEGVYWADRVYPEPVADAENREPYLPAPGSGPLPTYDDGWLDDVIAGLGDLWSVPIDAAKNYFGWNTVADRLLELKLKDLYLYYTDAAKRDELRGLLRAALLSHREKRIMVVAHSMGSIIAYDVLRRMGREDPNFRLDHFVTIGSPLGLPHVKHKIYEENDLVRTPSCVAKWTNFADRRDPVAFDVHLAEDYAANDRGVRVEDDLIINGYRGRDDHPNYHKSYGYLRAPEVSKLIRTFI